MIWKSDGSCLFGSTDVVWATSWPDWIATSEWIANEVVVSLEWYRSPSRTGAKKKDADCPSCSMTRLPPGAKRPFESESFADFYSPIPGRQQWLFSSKICDEFS